MRKATSLVQSKGTPLQKSSLFNQSLFHKKTLGSLPAQVSTIRCWSKMTLTLKSVTKYSLKQQLQPLVSE